MAAKQKPETTPPAADKKRRVVNRKPTPIMIMQRRALLTQPGADAKGGGIEVEAFVNVTLPEGVQVETPKDTGAAKKLIMQLISDEKLQPGEYVIMRLADKIVAKAEKKTVVTFD